MPGWRSHWISVAFAGLLWHVLGSYRVQIPKPRYLRYLSPGTQAQIPKSRFPGLWMHRLVVVVPGTEAHVPKPRYPDPWMQGSH